MSNTTKPKRAHKQVTETVFVNSAAALVLRLVNDLPRGSMFSASFVKRKKDEEGNEVERKGTFRLSRDMKAGKVGGEMSYSPVEKGLIPVYDMGIKQYRSIPVEGLRSVTLDGVRYELQH